jgi:hypothetical protein
MLDRHAVFRLDPHGSLLKCLHRTAARCGRRSAVLLRDLGVLALRFEVGDMRLLLVLDADERSRKSRDLELLRDNQRHRLTTEVNLVVIERTERRTRGGNLVFILLVGRGELGSMLVREYVEHACDRKRISGINALDPAFGDRG